MTENQIAALVVDAALKIHRALGPGLFESVYQATLTYELRKRGLQVREQVALPVYYETVKLDLGFRVDLIANGRVVVEIKSVEDVNPVHQKAIADVSSFDGPTARIAHQFQRGANQGWNTESG